MCRNYDIHKPMASDVEFWEALQDEEVKHYPGSYAVWPMNRAPVVWRDDDQRRMSLFEFGMMPSWAGKKDKKSWQWKLFNARDDRLLDSNLWEPRFKKQRCIIPANGFYEPYKHKEKVEVPGGRNPTDSIPFYFRLKSSDLFGFAGIWDSWTDKETGEEIRSFSIITTGPNEIITKIHNRNSRSPLILHKEDYDFWLGTVDKVEDLFEAGLFEPWPDDDMQAWQAHKGLDYGKNDEELIQPVENPVTIDGIQKELFET